MKTNIEIQPIRCKKISKCDLYIGDHFLRLDTGKIYRLVMTPPIPGPCSLQYFYLLDLSDSGYYHQPSTNIEDVFGSDSGDFTKISTVRINYDLPQ